MPRRRDSGVKHLMEVLNHNLFLFNELHLYHNLHSFSGTDLHDMEWNGRLKIGDTNRSQGIRKFAVEVSDVADLILT